MANIEMIRVAAGTPKIKVANTDYNEKQLKELIREADQGDCGLLLLPELTITGYTAADLFYQEFLEESQLNALACICQETAGLELTIILGIYLKLRNALYNCAAVIQKGKVRGIVPKMFIPAAGDSSEARWFAPGSEVVNTIKTVNIFNDEVPFGNLLFTDTAAKLTFGIEIGEDLAHPSSPGSHLALNGAHLILNPAASAEIMGRYHNRCTLIKAQSGKSICGYVYSSCGVHESTTDTVFSGHQIIAENGVILAENNRFERENHLTITEIDYGKLKFARMSAHKPANCDADYTEVVLEPLKTINTGKDMLVRKYAKTPFIPSDAKSLADHCQEVFYIQAAALAKRLEYIGLDKTIIGVSGGLDSTLALLVIAQTHKLLGLPAENIIAVTMPGFGTTDKTYQNALKLMTLLRTDVREISITASVKQHFQDIGHDETVHDLTYENAQARERTQILMDLSGKEKALLVGTGDLSELALGWCTYNGDHMSMYGINAGVPKTLLNFIVRWVMENKLSGSQEDKSFSVDNHLLKRTLQDILDTPISPELLPPAIGGQIAQKTEDSVGPYILHDFFLYHTLGNGMSPQKIFFIAKQTFADCCDDAFILRWLKVFYARLFSQQFKRSCMPDGPRIGTISLSPRAGLTMPSDADASLWINEVAKLK